jgi:hypothetical protein
MAIGDLHGDYASATEALRLAGAIDSSDRWVGGNMVVVQVGDQLDRGDSERRILDFFRRLRDEAAAAGGAFYPLIGNHETMNVEEDLRYVTEGGFAEFADVVHDANDQRLAAYPASQRGRVAAFLPGGPYAMMLAEHPVVLQVGRTVFVHGGLRPGHVSYGIENINREVAAWMRGEAPQPDALISGDGPLWIRDYSDETGGAQCRTLGAVLEALDADRMVVAHTVQDEINAACQDRVWRVDVGLADYYGGTTQVLEIDGDAVRAIR